MIEQIDIQKRFQRELSTFAMARKADQAGMTCANTFFAYDESGDITDGGWLKSMGHTIRLYPAINFPLAVSMLEDTDMKPSEIVFLKDGQQYILQYKGESYSALNAVDPLVEAWIKHKTK